MSWQSRSSCSISWRRCWTSRRSPPRTHFARSLVPQLRGEAGDPDRAVFAEGGYDPHEPQAFEGRVGAGFSVATNPAAIYYPKGRLQQDHPESVCRAVMVRTMTHKLIHRPLGVSELYDLARDPRETRNIHGDAAYATVRHRLECTLLDWYTRTSDVVPWDEHLRGLPPKDYTDADYGPLKK